MKTPTHALVGPLVTATLLAACAGSDFRGKDAVNVKGGVPSKRDSGSGANPYPTAQPPVDVAGSFLTMDCSVVDSVRGDGKSSVDCLVRNADGTPYVGGLEITKVAEKTAAGSEIEVPYTALQKPDKSWVVNLIPPVSNILEVSKFVAIRSGEQGVLEAIAFGVTQPFQKEVIEKDKLVFGFDHDACALNPNVVELGSSGKGACASGLGVTWIADDSLNGALPKMLCCPLKKGYSIGTYSVRFGNCAANEVLVGFENMKLNSLKCGALPPKVTVESELGPVLVPPIGVDQTVVGTAATVLTSAAFAGSLVTVFTNFNGRQVWGCGDSGGFVGRIGLPDLSILGIGGGGGAPSISPPKCKEFMVAE